jgi:DNA-binding response OmpR family regulator
MYRPLSLPGVRILIAERSAYLRTVIREHLFAAGVRHMRIAQDQVQVMAHLSGESFDAAIADWTLLTAGDGTLLKLLGSARRSGGAKMALLAAMSEPTRTSVTTARDSGVNAVVVRPFSERDLISRMHRILLPDPESDELEFRPVASPT